MLPAITEKYKQWMSLTLNSTNPNSPVYKQSRVAAAQSIGKVHMHNRTPTHRHTRITCECRALPLCPHVCLSFVRNTCRHFITMLISQYVGAREISATNNQKRSPRRLVAACSRFVAAHAAAAFQPKSAQKMQKYDLI